ncbi:MAG: histidinol dehydrogenase [Solirubrobacterales bacterium]|nr:histidinol dehydrogenase [Solirubrobacterales bacterium]
MRVSRFEWDGSGPRGLAGELRAMQPPPREVSAEVAKIVAAVAEEGDAAILRFEQGFGGVAPASLRVPDDELEAAPSAVPGAFAEALRAAMGNVERVCTQEPGLDAFSASSGQGATISYDSVPVAAAGAYVPGGKGAYPSTAIMCCVPARVAGVERIAVASPPGPDGRVNPLVLAAAWIAGATEAYAMGGAQAIAALALGTESIEPVDLVVGPGNRYVQEAKRQLVGRVGIDAIAGPSELMVVADGAANVAHLALDLCAQAEHGDDGLLVACAADAGLLAELEASTTSLAAERETVNDAPLALVELPEIADAVALADALAPEHLELACEGAAELARETRYAGCTFTGIFGGTALGDYAAGSNHVLPTGGAGRFTGPLGPSTFIRRRAIVEIDARGAEELAATVDTLARAEGFPVHGESAQARAGRGSNGG